MNLKRFTARTSREALALVRQAFGDDAVVMSTRPCPEGVEVLAMAPESVNQLERVAAGAEHVSAAQRPTSAAGVGASARNAPAASSAPSMAGSATAAAAAATASAREPAAATAAAAAAPSVANATTSRQRSRGGERIEPTFEPSVAEDVQQLQMSTLSFQDYVRERMLKRRAAAQAPHAEAPTRPSAVVASPIEQARTRLGARRAGGASGGAHEPPILREELCLGDTIRGALPEPDAAPAHEPASASSHEAHEAHEARAARASREARELREPSALRELDELSCAHEAPPLRPPQPGPARHAPCTAAREAAREAAHEVVHEAAHETARDDAQMLSELRSMRGLIEQRFGALAFMEKLQRQPRQAQLAQRLLDIGFSAALTRKLVESLPNDVAELEWAAGVLERNLATGEREGALEDLGGVYALIGATGVGKTTGTAKLAAAFATRHGAANLGLVTLDAYRVGAHEQLRTYGRILGVPVHTAHDRASLEDLLELLAGKRMVLIDTAGMAQRDHRTRELLEMLSHPSIKRLVVVNAAAQGETIEDQLAAYAGAGCRGVVLSKVDEAVKLGPALDATIRSRLKVLAVANGQRVPEDWHRLSAAALVQRALKAQGAPAWRLGGEDVNLIFAGMPAPAAVAADGAAAARAA